MTILNATIGQAFAVLATDTYVGPAIPPPTAAAVTGDISELERTDFRGDGRRPTVRPIATATKVVGLPHINTLIGGSGDWVPLQRLFAGCCMTAYAKTVEDLLADLPNALKTLSEESSNATMTVVVAGVSERTGTVVASAFINADGFMEHRLPVANVVTPVPNREDPQYGELENRWQRATQGVETEVFHECLAMNQWRTFAAGRYAQGFLIGGHLVVARVDAAGISIGKKFTFPKIGDDENV